MWKQHLVSTCFVLAAGSVAIATRSSHGEGGALAGVSSGTVVRDPAPTHPLGNAPGGGGELGLRLEPLTEALAAQLGIDPREGLLVAALDGEVDGHPSPLAPFDVILEVNREPASLAALERAIARGKGLCLVIARGGARRTVVLDGDLVPTAETSVDGPAGDFLSSDSLGADHPFYRLAAYRDLREGYRAREAAFRELAGEAKERSRELDREAKAEIAALRKRGEAEAAKYTEACEKEILALVDGRLTGELTEGIFDPPADVLLTLPEERASAVDTLWKQLYASLNDGFAAGLPITSDDERREERQRKAFGAIAERAAKRLAERCVRPWEVARGESRSTAEFLAAEYAEEKAWTAQVVAGVREQMHERITCAFRRTREGFGKRLGERLAKFDVPAPGEIEACLDDIRQQVDRMARRFLLRTESALDRFQAQTAGAHERLATALAAEFPASESAAESSRLALERILAKHFPADLQLDGSWRSKEALRDLEQALRADLADLVDDSRNGARPSAERIALAFTEHRKACHEAWNDLRDLLRTIHREAEANCWDIQEPRLEAPFPVPGESERSTGVAMSTR